MSASFSNRMSVFDPAMCLAVLSSARGGGGGGGYTHARPRRLYAANNIGQYILR